MALNILRLISLPNPEANMKRYPHQLSGGMRQRIMIAMALICDPAVLFADEPTTALDVTIQAQIIDLMNDLKEKTNTSIVLIPAASLYLGSAGQRAASGRAHPGGTALHPRRAPGPDRAAGGLPLCRTLRPCHEDLQALHA